MRIGQCTAVEERLVGAIREIYPVLQIVVPHVVEPRAFIEVRQLGVVAGTLASSAEGVFGIPVEEVDLSPGVVAHIGIILGEIADRRIDAEHAHVGMVIDIAVVPERGNIRAFGSGVEPLVEAGVVAGRIATLSLETEIILLVSSEVAGGKCVVQPLARVVEPPVDAVEVEMDERAMPANARHVDLEIARKLVARIDRMLGVPKHAVAFIMPGPQDNFVVGTALAVGIERRMFEEGIVQLAGAVLAAEAQAKRLLVVVVAVAGQIVGSPLILYAAIDLEPFESGKAGRVRIDQLDGALHFPS